MKNVLQACVLHIRHMREATRFSLEGLAAAFRNEVAFRQIVFVALPGSVIALCIADAWVERILLLLPLALAVIVELLNTAVENVVNRVSGQWHPLSKVAKDTASAAQFVAQLLVLVVWGSYLLEKFL